MFIRKPNAMNINTHLSVLPVVIFSAATNRKLEHASQNCLNNENIYEF